MNSMELYEQWERRVKSEAEQEGRKQGRKQGVRGTKKALLRLYHSRFGEPPEAIVAALDATEDPETLERWVDLFDTKSPDEIAAALAAG